MTYIPISRYTSLNATTTLELNRSDCDQSVKLHAMSKRREAAGGLVVYRIVLRETLIDLQRLQNDGGS